MGSRFGIDSMHMMQNARKKHQDYRFEGKFGPEYRILSRTKKGEESFMKSSHLFVLEFLGSEEAKKHRTINVLNIATQMFKLITLHQNNTDIFANLMAKKLKV